MRSPLWSVVLAAGSGRRLSSVTGGIPKQYWRPKGGRSLVEETLVRLAPICPPDRTVIVATETQRKHVDQWPSAGRRGRVVFQPEDRGTAAGVLFGLVPVLATEPHAIVVITPSDHGVENSDAFRRGIIHAVAHVQRHDEVVLFGVEPSAAETDYGWMTLEASKEATAVQSVASFVEKPAIDTARRLLAEGAVWNTMVIVARARTVFDLCREHLPELTRCFVGALTMPPLTRDAFLAHHYPELTTSDFSRGVLTPAVNLRAYTWPASMGWSDLGTPERLQHWLRTVPVELPRVSVAPVNARSQGEPVAAT